MTNTIKIGVLPGRIQEVAVEPTTTIADVIAIADLSAEGFEVKVDGTAVTDLTAAAYGSNLILLAKKIKGNSDPRTVTDGENTTITPR